ncbi:uncharacterized protein LOC124705378 isoform X2 [Lolium rigidum]|nr:uncharacterized protein LOC124705378 isoform X2 [Lolium rigidum]
MADDRPPHALVPAGLLPIHRPLRLCSGRTIPVLAPVQNRRLLSAAHVRLQPNVAPGHGLVDKCSSIIFLCSRSGLVQDRPNLLLDSNSISKISYSKI